MNFFLFEVLLFVILLGKNISISADEGEIKNERENEKEHSEEHSFEHDPHEGDPDYDEDVLTGTSHHQSKDSDESKKDMDELFKNIDSNNDGKIEKNELYLHIIESLKQLHNETAAEEFEKIDTDKNKKIALDEYCIFEHNGSLEELENKTRSDNSSELLKLNKTIHYEKERFKVADSNGDGFLDEHEYVLFKYPIFFPHMAHTVIHDYIEDIDSNHDGVADKDEYVKHFHVDDNKDKSAKEKSLQKAEEDFIKYDKDNNGKIDFEEFFEVIKPGYEEPARSETEYLINESDANKDGMVTRQEVGRHSSTWIGGDTLDPENQEIYDEHNHLEDEL